MKLIVELDVSESAMSIRNGTLAALVDSLSVPRMSIGPSMTYIQSDTPPRLAPQQAPAAPQTATAPAEGKVIDFAKAAEEARAKLEAEAAAKAAADAKAAALKAAKLKAKEAADAAAALAANAAALETGPATPETPAATAETPTEYTLESVRAVLARINKAGKTTQVKALLAAFGATKLTEISPSYYQALMEKAETL